MCVNYFIFYYLVYNKIKVIIIFKKTFSPEIKVYLHLAKKDTFIYYNFVQTLTITDCISYLRIIILFRSQTPH